jgi:hypothetical protein
MKRALAVVVGMGCFALIGVALLKPSPKNRLQPLAAMNASGQKPTKLPADALVLTLADGVEVVAPFQIRDDASAAGGVALVLPGGSKTKDHTGRASLSVTIPTPGTWQAWARVRWTNSCANSLTLKVGEAAEQLVGEDLLYSCWHWVEAGKFKLQPGKIPVTIIEREDGIAVDQLLFTCDAKYLPIGAISPAGEARGIRRFADDFSRSPGHGMEGWDLVSGKWDINFSFDPNRIPNQFALICDPGTRPGVAQAKNSSAADAVALIKGAPWYGCRLSFSFFPETDGRYGAILDRTQDGKESLQIAFVMENGKARIEAAGGGINENADAGSAVRLKQWHHVDIERWAWITHVFVDGNLVLKNYAATPRAGRVGFFVGSGNAVFDDVELEEIPWQADDGGELHIPWVVGEGGEWFRTVENEKVGEKDLGIKPLVGTKGSLSARLGDMPLEEVFIEQLAGAKGKAEVVADGLKPIVEPAAGGPLVLRRPQFEAPAKKDGAAATLKLNGEEARVLRVALRYGERVQKKYIIGPYHFTEYMIPDPSDYLDFTPEEQKKMAQSPDADKIERRAKFRPVVGDWGDDLSPWIRERGHWRVQDGILSAVGPSILRHMEETTRDLELRLRIRMPEPRSSAEIEMFAAPDPGIRIHIDGAKALSNPPREAAKPSAPSAVTLQMPDDTNWHDLIVRFKGNSLTAGIDKDAQKDIPVSRGDGGRMLLKVFSGQVDFDDIELALNKSDAEGGSYPFAQRETDWWREGSADYSEWMDHGGISCVLSSSWISLMAPRGEGLIWNKRTFGPDALLAFDVEENTEWFGWDKPHSHEHHPFDNISLVLAPEASVTPLKSGDKGGGYRLEVNAEGRSATILYRNGKEVARASQDRNFPMRYVGGHAPFFPRINRIVLLKRGNLVRGFVDGKEFIRYEDPEPIAVKRIGLGGYNTHINFSHMEAHTLAPLAPKEPAEKKTISSK